MSASEKLRELGGGFDRVTPIMRKTGPKMLGADAYVHAEDIHAYVNALPQIVAVVEAAEDVRQKMTGQRITSDTEEESTAAFVAIVSLTPALTALDEALS